MTSGSKSFWNTHSKQRQAMAYLQQAVYSSNKQCSKQYAAVAASSVASSSSSSSTRSRASTYSKHQHHTTTTVFSLAPDWCCFLLLRAAVVVRLFAPDRDSCALSLSSGLPPGLASKKHFAISPSDIRSRDVLFHLRCTRIGYSVFFRCFILQQKPTLDFYV